jgi:16S rRNA (uracil1498-N3)-methyltransferase
MRSIRLFVDRPLAPDAELPLPSAASEHATRALRLRAGDALMLFNGDGHDYSAQLLDAARGGARVRIAARNAPAAAESPLALTLVQGIARGEKMDWILQKATELGVACIAPVLTARTEVRLHAERGAKRMAHWRGVIASACEQCGRARLPQLLPPQPLAAWLSAAQPGIALFTLDHDAQTRMRDLPTLSAAQVVIGPEGGLDEADLLLLRAAGAQGLALGPRVLRTETAGMAALAMLQSHHGDA